MIQDLRVHGHPSKPQAMVWSFRSIPVQAWYEPTSPSPVSSPPRPDDYYPWNRPKDSSYSAEAAAQGPWNTATHGGPHEAPPESGDPRPSDVVNLRALGPTGDVLANIGLRFVSDLALCARTERVLEARDAQGSRGVGRGG